jgi:hypothetical protein
MARIIERNGKSQSISAWARENGIRLQKVYARLSKGWPLEEALGFVPHVSLHKRRVTHGVDHAMITVRVTHEQYAAIKSASHRCELSINQFCANAILHDVGRVMPVEAVA